jgi:uncharacterized membrane-anchored protein
MANYRIYRDSEDPSKHGWKIKAFVGVSAGILLLSFTNIILAGGALKQTLTHTLVGLLVGGVSIMLTDFLIKRFRDAVQKYRKTNNLCLSCGYNLAASEFTFSKCPECGK